METYRKLIRLEPVRIEMEFWVKNSFISLLLIHSIILALLCCVLSPTEGYFTTSTKVHVTKEEAPSRAKRDTFSLPASSADGNITGTTNEKVDAIIRLKRRLTPMKIDKDCIPTTSATNDGSPPMLDDYVNLGLSDDLARKIEADYKWSVVGKSPAAEGEMNSFIDDYVQQFDDSNQVKHTVGGQRRRILNVVISDMTYDKKIIISNKNYTW